MSDTDRESRHRDELAVGGILAALHYLHQTQKARPIHVMMPYADRLRAFSLLWVGMVHDYFWYRDDPAFVRVRDRVANRDDVGKKRETIAQHAPLRRIGDDDEGHALSPYFASSWCAAADHAASPPTNAAVTLWSAGGYTLVRSAADRFTKIRHRAIDDSDRAIHPGASDRCGGSRRRTEPTPDTCQPPSASAKSEARR